MINVSANIMMRVCGWLGLQSRELKSGDARSWHDAPESEFRYGMRALRKPGKYNQIAEDLFAEWKAATGVQTKVCEGFSDRTGSFSFQAIDSSGNASE